MKGNKRKQKTNNKTQKIREKIVCTVKEEKLNHISRSCSNNRSVACFGGIFHLINQLRLPLLPSRIVMWSLPLLPVTSPSCGSTLFLLLHTPDPCF